MLIKRDDLSDLTASGNKIRKLEFILPDILAGSHDWILSLGPTQSNSCRVVSAIAPRVGLRPAHVLVKDAHYKEDRSAEGNLFFHKLFGAELFLISRDEYVKIGQQELLQEARERLIREHGAVNPYLLPMGGSTVHGLFGYIECFRELELQLEESALSIDEIFFSCGSGGTAAGLAIGKYISTSPILKNVQLSGYVAWETPEYFHRHVNEMLKLVGLDNEVKSEEILRFVQSKGLGYALNSAEELQVIREVARSSGIVLDGTYTSKAVTTFIKEERDEGRKCLFIHTGGLFSMIGREDV
jgi:1-aminocyclopropane-1-carboxylate deaminase/D-cysteine desulfhydrase-like pyridoxal-dependent ACC family enzyme